MNSPEHSRAKIHPRARTAFFTWAALLFILSVMPISPMPETIGFDLPDTVYHAAFYMPFAALFLWAFPKGSRLSGWARAALAAFLFGMVMELVQALLPWRHFEWIDAAANLAGGGAGAALAVAFPRLPFQRLSRGI